RTIVADFPGLAQAKNPRFLMVSGVATIRARGGGLQRSLQAVLYVAELTTGEINAYGLNYSPQMAQAPNIVTAQLMPLDKAKFRQAIPQAGGVGGIKKKN
ncbi:MAG: hypothetical protein N2C14_11765, partial [Planctomycetales bacterium]